MRLGLHIDVPKSIRDGCVELRGPEPRKPHDLQRNPLALDLGFLLSLWVPGWGLSLYWKFLTPRKILLCCIGPHMHIKKTRYGESA